MRATQNEVCILGGYGRLYETVDEPKREVPRRVINPEVAAWRLGRRAVNPRTESQLIFEAGSQCIAMVNLE